MRDIQSIRKDIDRIDDEIVKLLKDRFSLAEDVIEYKVINNLSIYDRDREVMIIEDVKEKLSGYKYSEEVVDSIENIMENSKKIQEAHRKRIKTV